jgi:hypothetical protein
MIEYGMSLIILRMSQANFLINETASRDNAHFLPGVKYYLMSCR